MPTGWVVYLIEEKNCRAWENPRQCYLGDGDIAGAFGDFSDEEAFGLGEDFFGFGGRDDEGHADAHVEDLIHLGFGDFSAFLDKAEEFGDLPGVFADGGAAGFGKDAGEVVEQPATGDVGGAVEAACWEGGHEGLVIRVDL